MSLAMFSPSKDSLPATVHPPALPHLGTTRAIQFDSFANITNIDMDHRLDRLPLGEIDTVSRAIIAYALLQCSSYGAPPSGYSICFRTSESFLTRTSVMPLLQTMAHLLVLLLAGKLSRLWLYIYRSYFME